MGKMSSRQAKRVCYVLIFSLACFLFGAFSSLQNTKGGRSWVLAARDRLLSATPDLPFSLKNTLSSFLGVKEVVFPEITQTLRYDILVKKRFDLKIEGQLAQNQNGSIFAVDRNQGTLYRLESISDSRVLRIGNLFNVISKYNQDGSKPIRITDLHYSFDKFQVAVVLTDSSQTDEWLQLYSFNLLSDTTISNLESLFMTPRIADRKNTDMWGGRISDSSSSLFISVGEQRYDRSGFPKLSPQAKFEQSNSRSVFGCIMKLNPKVSTPRRFSCGHRNAQGLFFDKESNALFESEHGPSGGDEVNILETGVNYGWPMVSLGGAYGWPVADGSHAKFDVSSANTKYEKRLAEFGFLRGTHRGYRLPVMSWIPSVGASQIIKVSDNSKLVDWNGDLLVGTMTETAMHRIRLMDKHVVLDERIPLGLRIRDMLMTPSGNLIISTDNGQIVNLVFHSKN